ncbi:MAG TPA: hypothetical protein VE981_00950 [Planctomycetota bacterium]|nr:hypothetical protein [Planctomycetota bacterium]
MKRARWAVLGGVAVILAATAVVVLRPRPAERFPLAELVPADAIFYAGFTHYQELEELPTPWAAEIRKKLDPVRPHLSGGLAFYLDRNHEWVTLARLTRGSALLAGAEVENGAAVIAQTPEALTRHKAREGSLSDLPEFKSLGLRCFFNLERLKPRGRLRDFSALGFEVASTSPLTLRGRALYKGGLFRTYLEQYVQAPKHGAPGGAAPARIALTEHFPRVWEEVTHELLDTIDCEKAEREAQMLSRDFLEGKSLREFLGRLGPTWGIELVPTPFGRPALVVWIELPEEGTRDLAAKMVHRSIGDSIRLRRDRGLAPAFEVMADGGVWRVKLSSAKAIRYGEAFAPAYIFEKNRFVFSTCATVLTAPAATAGDAHAAGTVEVGPLIDLVRSLAPGWADDAFRGEAERQASMMSFRTFSPGMMTALRKQFPDPADLTKYQEAQRARFEAQALDEISKGTPWREELTRVKASIEAWADRVSWLERVEVSGRFASEGLEFEARLQPVRR